MNTELHLQAPGVSKRTKAPDHRTIRKMTACMAEAARERARDTLRQAIASRWVDDKEPRRLVRYKASILMGQEAKPKRGLLGVVLWFEFT